ncbi:MAG: mycofactocin precursor MftA [Actinomycetes bacterium]
MENPRPSAVSDAGAETPEVDEEILAETLIEDVSIDGMCGVY